MDLQTFLSLPNEVVAHLMRRDQPRTCVFPINGTRRWFTLEHSHKVEGDPLEAYMDISGRNHIDLFHMFFDHGIDTLISPIFGLDILKRSEEYLHRIARDGMARLATHPDFVNFYHECDVRVHFYGSYRKHMLGTYFEPLIEKFDSIVEATSKHTRHRLFFGVFGDDSVEMQTELTVRYYLEYGKIPDRRELIELYYGEAIRPASIFIGFDRFSVFDYPLLSNGDEDLYFTVSPSPYLSVEDLRRILYDHLFTRRAPDPEYEALPIPIQDEMRAFYRQQAGTVLGVGRLHHGFWTPTQFEQIA
jgi:adenosine tuberculosinyltransferase